jgi:CubicO group peptidase (beta-lactamase class C family)
VSASADARSIAISGRWLPQYELVVSAFRRNFWRHAEQGAACAIYVNGELVVDIWAGEARPGVPWAGDTLATVWSTTKGMAAACIALLADREIIDVTKPVVEYWPEFGRHGKDRITLAHVLTHTAGLPYWDGYANLLTINNGSGWGRTDDIVAALADARPLWPPGEKMAYHALTIGWLLGEVVRRVTGRTMGQFLRQELAEPLDLDMWIGLPETHLGRVADLLPWPRPTDPRVISWMAETFNPDALPGKAMLVDPSGGGTERAYATANSKEFRISEAPGGNGNTTAASLAKLYAMLALGGTLGGRRYLQEHTVRRHSEIWAAADDLFAFSYRRRALGFARPCPNEVYGPNDEAFGHAGMGGSLGFADPVTGIGFGYVMNQMLLSDRLDPRPTALIYALYDCYWNSEPRRQAIK